MTARQPTPDQLIQELGSGELALLLALFQDSIACCRAGDSEACRWLRLCAARWLKLLALDPEPLVERLLRMAGTTASAGVELDPGAAPAEIAAAAERRGQRHFNSITRAVQLSFWPDDATYVQSLREETS